MLDWMSATPQNGEVHVWTIVLKLCLALVAGVLVAGVYCAVRRKRPRAAVEFTTTIVLLTVLVAMTTIVIDDNVARAFSLVGALSIVRFRTVVDDTRDTTFVIFAVVAGMAVGAGNFVVAAVGVPLVAVASLLLGLAVGAATLERTLEIRIANSVAPDPLFAPIFDHRLASCRLTRATPAKQGDALNLRYAVRMKAGRAPQDLLLELRRLDGVLGVELADP